MKYVAVAAMKKYLPTDATTNPSLILQASQKSQYDQLINDAIDFAKKNARFEIITFCGVMCGIICDNSCFSFLYLMFSCSYLLMPWLCCFMV
jgi:transaldolase